jgi:hypothetical protein
MIKWTSRSAGTAASISFRNWCWAHARRKFVDQHKASGSPIAREAIKRVAVLYRVEAEAKAMTDEDRHTHRQQHAVPALRAIKAWLATAKANGHEPQARLTDVLTRLSTTLDRDIATLLSHTRQPIA